MSTASASVKGERLQGGQKGKDVRTSNIIAAKAIADCVRTSLGPRGMDKMIKGQKGNTLITNDGATILKEMKVHHPAAKMLCDLSKSQDVEAGDGTTSVVVVAGALLTSCMTLLEKGIHPTQINEAFGRAHVMAAEILESVAIPVDLTDRESIISAATTSLSSKVISQYSGLFAPLAVDAVLKIVDPLSPSTVDLNDIKIVTRIGGTMDDTEMVDGLVFPRAAAAKATGPKEIRNAKIGLIQFCLSAPKTNIENNVIISEYSAMDRILREERKYILGLCKKIKKSGCNVLLVQKSILRDATNDLSLHFLAKLGIMVVTNIERSDVEFICKTAGCTPVADIDSMEPSKLGTAALAAEVNIAGSGPVVKITGIENHGKTVSVLIRGSNQLVLEEADRSLHDALCVVRSIVKKNFLIAGGGAPETAVAVKLMQKAKTVPGKDSYCLRAYAEALEVIPYTLAENAGMHPIAIVTELRARHAAGEHTMGINVRCGAITNMQEEKVLQPLLVTLSSLSLATETVRMILKIDDLVATR
jgi:T-complex protein 1 subunit delta